MAAFPRQPEARAAFAADKNCDDADVAFFHVFFKVAALLVRPAQNAARAFLARAFTFVAVPPQRSARESSQLDAQRPYKVYILRLRVGWQRVPVLLKAHDHKDREA